MADKDAATASGETPSPEPSLPEVVKGPDVAVGAVDGKKVWLIGEIVFIIFHTEYRVI